MHGISRLGITLPFLLLGLGAISSSAQLPVTPASNVTPLFAALRPGDMLRLKVWREPDFSGDFLVDETGQAVLPRLGKTSVTGLPTDRLKVQLEEQYREFLNNPSIEVIPLRQVAILGAVRNPGVYRIEPAVTLGQVINLAGGPASNGKRNRLELRRGPVRTTIDLDKHPDQATALLMSGDQVLVPENGWLHQNATWFVSTIVGILGTTAFLVTR